uniref:Uncharacterized protein n=1 Tax=Sinorhizobium fredii (strain NBRC 101917 / NGR234) TaxID=394 RepID=Q6W165_SINFN|nr:Hypothetical protein RNGR00378 [Sinorhizobium fredii NGR234]
MAGAGHLQEPHAMYHREKRKWGLTMLWGGQLSALRLAFSSRSKMRSKPMLDL